MVEHKASGDLTEVIAGEDSSDPEIACSRTPLRFVIPRMQKTQCDKNPFKKRFMKLKSDSDCFNEALTANTCPQTLIFDNDKTFREIKRAKIQLKQPPKPSLFNSEPDEIPEELGKKIGEDTKEVKLEIILDVGKEPKEKKEELNYVVKLTKEVEYNFTNLGNIKEVTTNEIMKKSVLIPELKDKRLSNKTLLLDLDETLLHTMDPKLNYDVINVDQKYINSTSYLDEYLVKEVNIKVILRPYVREFLSEIGKYYELIVIFTLLIDIYSRTKMLC